MNLSYVKFKDVDLADPFFDSLKSDYVEFSDWFGRKAEDLAYIFTNSRGMLDGFLYLKIEDGAVDDVIPVLPYARRLKVGTMKINAHGTKLGERFIKKIFDHAIKNQVVEIYVTVFGEHGALISLFERYGFNKVAIKTTVNGEELVLVKNIFHITNNPTTNYPSINLKRKSAYLLGIKPQWHTKLLPDSILRAEQPDIVQDVSHTNSIHKVYLAAMKGMEVLQRGDVILIYRTTDGQGPAHYRSVGTSLCVVEEYRSIRSFASWDEFYKYCSPYSVFTDQELEEFWQRKSLPHVLRFTYNIALKKRVTRGEMIESVGLPAGGYWGFMPLSHEQFKEIARRGMIDEGLIVD